MLLVQLPSVQLVQEIPFESTMWRAWHSRIMSRCREPNANHLKTYRILENLWDEYFIKITKLKWGHFGLFPCTRTMVTIIRSNLGTCWITVSGTSTDLGKIHWNSPRFFHVCLVMFIWWIKPCKYTIVSWVHETLRLDLWFWFNPPKIGYSYTEKNVVDPSILVTVSSSKRSKLRLTYWGQSMLLTNWTMVNSSSFWSPGDPLSIARWQPRQSAFRYTADGDPLGSRAGSNSHTILIKHFELEDIISIYLYGRYLKLLEATWGYLKIIGDW